MATYLMHLRQLPRPPLGKSDHDVIYLLPKYKARLKQEKPAVKEIALWSGVCKERLRDYYEDTNWHIFFANCANANELTDNNILYYFL